MEYLPLVWDQTGGKIRLVPAKLIDVAHGADFRVSVLTQGAASDSDSLLDRNLDPKVTHTMCG